MLDLHEGGEGASGSASALTRKRRKMSTDHDVLSEDNDTKVPVNFCPFLCAHHPTSLKYPHGFDFPHAKNLEKFTRDFSRALQGVFPRIVDYGHCHILYISWEDDDLGTVCEIEKLKDAMQGIRFSSRDDDFSTAHYQIPSRHSQMELEYLIAKTRLDYALNREDLLTIYYGGHGRLSQAGHSIWHAHSGEDTPNVDWTKVEELLMPCEGNILFILDCCASATTASGMRWQGTKEALVATCKSGKTNGVGSNSFTSGLINCLQDPQLRGQSLTIVALHAIMMERMMDYGLHSAPQYIGLSRQCHSLLLRFPCDDASAVDPLNDERDVMSTAKQSHNENEEKCEEATESIRESLESDCRILLLIRLSNPERPVVTDDWLVWLKNFAPPGIESVDPLWGHVRLEGVFQSRSTLAMVSIPVAIWNILPHDPAYTFIDVIESENLMNVRPTQCLETVTTKQVSRLPCETPSISTSEANSITSEDKSSRDATLAKPPENTTEEALTHFTAREQNSPLVRSNEMRRSQNAVAFNDPRFLHFSTYQFRALRSDSSFRLIKIFKTPLGESLPQYEMIEVDTATHTDGIHVYQRGSVSEEVSISYEAVSCHAGSSQQHQIHVWQDGWLTRMRVSRSLALMLGALSYTDRERLLWIDAICIDQEYLEEKSIQMELIPVILRASTRHLVWVGQGNAESETAIEFLKNEILNGDLVTDFVIHPKHAEKRKILLRFLQNRCFLRRWIIQGLVFARNSVMVCGSASISWEDFAAAIELLNHIRKTTRYQHLPSDTSRSVTHGVQGWFERVSLLSASLLVRVTGMIAQTHVGIKRTSGQEHDLVRSVLSLEALVCGLAIFETFEPCDTIYSLLAISKDARAKPVQKYESAGRNRQLQISEHASFPRLFQTDYMKEFVEMCKDFVEFCVLSDEHKRTALDILCQPWAPMSYQSHLLGVPKSLPPPSWVRQVSGAPFTMFTHLGNNELRLSRRNADSLVGISLEHYHKYDASGGFEFDPTNPEWRRALTKDYYSMFVDGFVLDEVKTLTSASQGGNIPFEWLKLAGWTSPEREPVTDELWQTLVAGRSEQGLNPAPYYPGACKEVIRRGIRANGTITLPDLIHDKPHSVLALFSQRVQAAIWNRVMIRSRNGHLGLVSRDVQEGDLICILYGCSVPVILRKKTTEDAGEEAKHLDKSVATAKLPKERVTRSSIVKVVQQVDQQAQTQHAARRPQSGMTKNENAPQTTQRPEAQQEQGDSPDEIGASSDKQASGHESREVWYEFLGECYVNNMMDGEARAVYDKCKLKTERFELR